jgi:outer membrane usher protein
MSLLLRRIIGTDATVNMAGVVMTATGMARSSVAGLFGGAAFAQLYFGQGLAGVAATVPAVTIKVAPAASTASAAAAAPNVGTAPVPGPMHADSSSVAPAIKVAALPVAAAATGSATAAALAIHDRPTPAAYAAASAPEPTVDTSGTDATVAPPAAVATATAPAPTLEGATEETPLLGVQGGGWNPHMRPRFVQDVRLRPPAALAYAWMPAPTLTDNPPDQTRPPKPPAKRERETLVVYLAPGTDDAEAEELAAHLLLSV